MLVKAVTSWRCDECRQGFLSIAAFVIYYIFNFIAVACKIRALPKLLESRTFYLFARLWSSDFK